MRGTVAQDTKGTQAQATFNKGASLHNVLFKHRKSTQTDYRCGLCLNNEPTMVKESEPFGQMDEPFCGTQALMNAPNQVV
jgi:hypothetical protein